MHGGVLMMFLIAPIQNAEVDRTASRSLSFPGQGFAVVLDDVQIRDDGVGYQETLGGQEPAAIRCPVCQAMLPAPLQHGLQGGEGQKILLFVLLRIDARGGAQAGGQVFSCPLPGGDLLHIGEDGAAGLEGADIFVDVLDDVEPLPGEIGAGARAEAQVFPAHPIFQIVLGHQSFSREVGDLILPEAPALENVHRCQVHICLGVVIGQVQQIPVFIEGRARLDLQGVAAHMLRIDGKHMLQAVLPVEAGLTRQTVHQIQGQVLEARFPDALHRGEHLGIGMGPAQLFEHLVVVVLHAHAYPVKALSPEAAQELVGDGVRIGLKGDLRVRRHIEAAPDGGKDGRHAVGSEKAGGAAAEVHRIHLIAGSQLAGFLDVGADRVNIPVQELVVLGCHRVEVAVLAFAAAEGYMDIYAQRDLIFLSKQWHTTLPPNPRLISARP